MSEAAKSAFGGAAGHAPASPWDARPTENWRSLREALASDGATATLPTEATAGYEQGRDQGYEQARAELAQRVQQYQQSLTELASLRQTIMQQTERDLVALALHVAEQVIVAALPERADFASRMVRHALHLLAEGDNITLRVAAEDLQALTAQVAGLDAARGVTLVEDPRVGLGGVVAECTLGSVDATLQRRLADMARLLTHDAAGT